MCVCVCLKQSLTPAGWGQNLLLIFPSSGVHTSESFDIVVRGNGFTLGKAKEGALCRFKVKDHTYGEYCTALPITAELPFQPSPF